MSVWSSECYLTRISSIRTICGATTLSSSTFQNLSLNRKLFLIYSCKSPPTLLEDASNDLKTTKLLFNSKTLKPSPVREHEITAEFICGLCKNPQTDSLAFEYYLKARKRDPIFRPDSKTLKLLIEGLLKSRKWDCISSLVEDFRILNVFPDTATCCKLVAECITARKFKLGVSILRVLEADPGIAIRAYGSAMQSCNKLQMYKMTNSMYNQMVGSGLSLDSCCFYYLIESQGRLGDTENVFALFKEYESKKFDDDKVSARVYSCLCDSLGKSGRAFEALRYFREMQSKGIPPSRSMYESLISSFADIKEAEIAEDIFQEARGKKMVKNQALFQKLVLMYVELRSVEKTISIVEVMVDIGVRVSDCVLCAVVNGYVRKRGLRAAVKVFEHVTSLGCEPGQVTYASILSVYCRLGLAKKAEFVFSKMLEKGYDKCLIAYSNMISMYGKSSKVSDAMRLLAKMKEKGCEPNVWVYNTLLEMHGRKMNLKQVEKLWKEMNRRNVKPDKISYTSVITAYGKVKEFDECIRIYQEFRSKNGEIDRTLAAVMVGVYSKSSRINELIKLLHEIKSKGIGLDGRLYKSSLNALRDAGLQSQVKWFENIFTLEKEKT